VKLHGKEKYLREMKNILRLVIYHGMFARRTKVKLSSSYLNLLKQTYRYLVSYCEFYISTA